VPMHPLRTAATPLSAADSPLSAGCIGAVTPEVQTDHPIAVRHLADMIHSPPVVGQDDLVTLALPTFDAFAGAGGLSLGLTAAGLPVTVAADSSEDAVATYRSHHPATTIIEGDIAAHRFSRYKGEVAIVAGGPPCQPWSSGGKRLGQADGRDGLKHFLRIVDEIRPLAFLMENVPGLAAPGNIEYLRALISDLTELGYQTDYHILDATSYGVPQRRRRLFIVGITDGHEFRWPTATNGLGAPHPVRAAGEVISRDFSVGDPNPSKVTYAKKPVLRPSAFAGLLFNGGGRPLNLGAPAPTVLARSGWNRTPWVDTANILPEYHAHLRKGGAPRAGVVPGARRLTVAEAALLQTFPRSLEFAGSRSSQYAQVGNGVPPDLAAAVSRALVQALGAEPVPAAA
jgi:DNA (cytosine-5)-methyltransferase 1